MDDALSRFAHQPFERKIHHRRCVKCEGLADDKAAADGDAERASRFAAGAECQCEGQGAADGRQRGHDDGTKTFDAGLADGGVRRHAAFTFRFQCEIDQHDGVLFHDAHEQNDADDAHDAEFGAGDEHGQQRADAGGRQAGNDRQRVDQAFVQNA